MREFFLDARQMQHPEPLERSIEILKQLDFNSYLYMLHRKEPIPLLALANEHNLNFIAKLKEDNNWHILITPNKETILEEFIVLRD